MVALSLAESCPVWACYVVYFATYHHTDAEKAQANTREDDGVQSESELPQVLSSNAFCGSTLKHLMHNGIFFTAKVTMAIDVFCKVTLLFVVHPGTYDLDGQRMLVRFWSRIQKFHCGYAASPADWKFVL